MQIFGFFYQYFWHFLAAIALAALSTLLVAEIAMRLGILDKPDGLRKLHEKPIPLLGGLAVFVSFWALLFWRFDLLIAGNLDPIHWLSFFVGGLFIMLGGYLDDRYHLRPVAQIVWPVLAVGTLLLGGVEISQMTNPLGGLWQMDSIVFDWSIATYHVHFSLISAILLSVWLMMMMYSTKLLDGADGLVTGVSAIGALIIFLFTASSRFYQADLAYAALMLLGAAIGFLFFNWAPAQIYLGDGGSLFFGYALGVLAVISGGKIAIALLVIGIPVLDTIWTIIRRLLASRNPFASADREHLHFLLIDSGLGVKRTVVLYYLIATAFGVSALFLQTKGKLMALLLLIFLMALMIYGARASMKKYGK